MTNEKELCPAGYGADRAKRMVYGKRETMEEPYDAYFLMFDSSSP